jgi:hypothetical protein
LFFGKAYDGTHNRLYPSLTIHLSNLSRIFSSFGRSPLISPDISILVNGGHRDRSDTFIDPVLLLKSLFSDILRTLRLQVDFLKALNASFLENPSVLRNIGSN